MNITREKFSTIIYVHVPYYWTEYTIFPYARAYKKLTHHIGTSNKFVS
jgi:hypothetical protein